MIFSFLSDMITHNTLHTSVYYKYYKYIQTNKQTTNLQKSVN
jgi:hypothetical protein